MTNKGRDAQVSRPREAVVRCLTQTDACIELTSENSANELVLRVNNAS